MDVKTQLHRLNIMEEDGPLAVTAYFRQPRRKKSKPYELVT